MSRGLVRRARARRAADVAFATADGTTPGFLAVRHFVHEGALHLYVMDVLGDDPEWIQRLRADPAIRVRIGGRVYPGRAVPVTEPAAIEALLPTLLRQVHRVEAGGARWDPAPAPYPGTQIRQWFFRVESGEVPQVM